jgi:hypothetical protein
MIAGASKKALRELQNTARNEISRSTIVSRVSRCLERGRRYGYDMSESSKAFTICWLHIRSFILHICTYVGFNFLVVSSL